MADMEKTFLDYAGLAVYDELIKAYIKQQDKSGDINNILTELVQAQEDISANADNITSLNEAIDVLNGEGEGSVKATVDEAISGLIDNAPEALDTLKEIADWIAQDEANVADIVEKIGANEEKIAANEQKINDLKAYIDVQDKAYYDSIGSIVEPQIISLFKTPVELQEGQTVAEAIANLGEDEKLVLTEDVIVDEDIVVPAGAYIDAKGAEFTGLVKVAPDAVIENAVFTGKVVVE